jgi:hypothetical protein
MSTLNLSFNCEVLKASQGSFQKLSYSTKSFEIDNHIQNFDYLTLNLINNNGEYIICHQGKNGEPIENQKFNICMNDRDYHWLNISN